MRIRKVFTAVTIGFLVTCIGCSSNGKKGSARMKITADRNPTTDAGRGAPSLEDKSRPAAWIYIDGQKGTFTEQDGHLLLQWIIQKPVSATPTFRVEIFEDLLKPPIQFKCVLQTRETAEGARISYGIAADNGTFECGHDYSLLDPGEGFSIRNPETGELVSEIEPLAPGDYLLAGSIEGSGGGAATVAVTYFTVGG